MPDRTMFTPSGDQVILHEQPNHLLSMLHPCLPDGMIPDCEVLWDNGDALELHARGASFMASAVLTLRAPRCNEVVSV